MQVAWLVAVGSPDRPRKAMDDVAVVPWVSQERCRQRDRAARLAMELRQAAVEQIDGLSLAIEEAQ